MELLGLLVIPTVFIAFVALLMVEHRLGKMQKDLHTIAELAAETRNEAGGIRAIVAARLPDAREEEITPPT